MFKKLSLILIAFISIHQLSSQNQKNRKTIKTKRISKAPKIDGILNDEAWQNAEICSDFVILRPDNGKPVSKEYQTTVKVIYNDDAIYISAEMLDPDPKGIPQEFAVRDNFGLADFFLVTINPNDDGQNPFEFIVQSTGNQGDAKVSNGNEDLNWSAVWDSAAKITDKGWNVEMEIPYRALRFANRPVQSWGFNFHRRLEKLNQQHTWTHIDNTVGRWTQYDGLITDFRNIKPPTRLNLYPYASATSTTFEGNTDFNYSVGMDIKYGLTENFTLDATLIPDFSQVGFDDVELNLGPFEQQFTEQRQFFTEGTELFNIANLFYSRRIGAQPIDQFDVESSISEDEEITDYPGKVTMLNAVKISGRTQKGLGIGFFNAITEKTEATIKNNTTGTERKEVIDPFTNYNILVLDQQFNQNSTISLINTNVTRSGSFRDANVTALDWHIETKDSKYNADGSVKMSSISDDVNNNGLGYYFDNSFGYNSGHWNWELGYNFENKDYNPNDLGILFSNNQQTIYGSAGWRTLQPTKKFNSYNFYFYNNAEFQHYSGIFTGYSASFGASAQTRKRFFFGGNLNYETESKDFFEPRQGTTSGVYFLQPERKNINMWISTNSQKKFQVDADAWYTAYSNNPKVGYGFSVAPRYRFTNQFSLQYRLNYNQFYDDQGYVDEDDTNIIFGMRDRKNYTNSISGKYSFSTKSSLSLTFRHYWGAVNYNDYYNLTSDGGLNKNDTYEGENVNFNSWNLDLNYIWQFAPGSQLIAFYRNSIYNSDTNSNLNFFKNLDNLFAQSHSHTFSVRFVYFIDYNKIKNIF
ncbi:hypothetical protein BW723_11845 [Polaribacter reichenbachii]|uniref:Uncharacterized protein n=1 Tax=Polaribacter reichenbachii TaxID=996801 RepID=A0A1B8TPH3_9FLAO|nr:DUF5916 domain-containing protein [Polaribacter reichenbachii]APZ46934.1 hypothetical protein BW723_11845 [Polaribacter reichenbachii]AUC17577.1 hypothetical protein BTO17_02290 [Polaribacter reichenbachii]OBY61550.1 hypothetical protein LPB301_15930 [Polaribacter reichenbachii]